MEADLGYNLASLNTTVPFLRLFLVGAIASLLTACSNPVSPSTSPSATAGSPAASATPSGYRLLIVSIATNGAEIFLYDSASNAPQQLVSVNSLASTDVQFIGGQKIAYSQATSGPSSEIDNFDLGTRATAAPVTSAGLIPAFAFSHDGSMLAYLLHDTAGNASLHIRRNGQESSLKLNSIPGRGVGSDDQLLLQYSPDDKYLLMVDTFVGNQAQAPETGQFLVLRTADNSVAFLPPAGTSSNATMATWGSHSDRLYYRDQIGVRTWDAGAASIATLATGLRWYNPAVSPDDRFIAYTEFDSQSIPHVKLFDLQSNQTSLSSSAPRSHPIFITADLIWSLEEQPCTSECLGGPSQSTGKVFAYSLKSKTESSLPFTDVHALFQPAVAGR